MSPVCFVNHVPSTLRLLAPRFSVGSAKPEIHPESHRDGAHACNVFARRMKKHKPGATPVNVKLLLPPRQSRGFSQSNGLRPHLQRHNLSPRTGLMRVGAKRAFGSDEPSLRRGSLMIEEIRPRAQLYLAGIYLCGTGNASPESWLKGANL